MTCMEEFRFLVQCQEESQANLTNKYHCLYLMQWQDMVGNYTTHMSYSTI